MSLRNLSTALCITCGRNLPAPPKPTASLPTTSSASQQKYCSQRCRSSKPNKFDVSIEEKMLEMARKREIDYRTGRFEMGKSGNKGKEKSVWLTCEEVEEVLRGELGSLAKDGLDDRGGGGKGLEKQEQPMHSLQLSSDDLTIERPDTNSNSNNDLASRIPKDLRERTRRAARRLAARDLVVLLQGGKELPPGGAAGVMEVRLKEGTEVPARV